MALHVWIPAMPQKSYAYRRGDAQIIYDDNHSAIVIDGGEEFICNQLISFCKSHGITHVTYILSHWHPDHDRGLKLFLESSIIVDVIYCPPPADLKKTRDSDAAGDYSRAISRLDLAKRYNKKIVYPPADQYTNIKVGEIECRIWRRSVKTSENIDYQVNNTSMCCYFPQFYYVTTGDTINAFDTFLQTKPGKILIFKIPHHGNACTSKPCGLLKDAGAMICWYNHAEAAGVGIGGDGFSKWGAKYCKNQGFICLRPFHEITMTIADKTLSVRQNGSLWTYDVPYTGVTPEGWVHNIKGWWYQFKNGTWAVGWNKLTKDDKYGWYYFDESGYMVTGWIKVNGYWYYLDADGLMLTGWLDYKGRKCYLDGSGKALCNCTVTIDGKTYTFDDQCYAVEVPAGTPAAAPATKPVINHNSGFKGYNVGRRTDPIMYIVIHYTGAEGTAKNNIDYFNRANRSASADFFVGHSGEIWQYTPDLKSYYSWHCGGGRQSSKGGTFYGRCKNANSIGIELCTRKINGAWTFTDETVAAAKQLVRYLMEEYGVKRANVIRHFDVNGKYCPNVSGWLEPSGKWDAFKASLTSGSVAPAAGQIYRVRKSANDVRSQIGAFTVLANAKAKVAANPGYHVYDSSGKEV